MKNPEIKNLFKKKFKEDSIKISDSSKGYDQIVKIIEGRKGKYILKLPRREKHIIKNQVIASKKWSKVGVPVPKILYYNKDFLIESFIVGEPLNKIKISDKKKSEIYFELGKLMRKMHSVKAKGYGGFRGKRRAVNRKQKDYEKWIRDKVLESRDFIENKKLFSPKELKLLDNYLKKNLNFPKIKSVLTHQDLVEEHILIKDGKISGIIDLADIKGDEAMSDFRRIAKEKDEEKFMPYLIKGYSVVDTKRINLHRFLLIMYIIPKLYKMKKYKRLKYFISKIKKEIK